MLSLIKLICLLWVAYHLIKDPIWRHPVNTETPAPVGPFRRGVEIGKAIVGIAIFGTLGLIVGLLTLVVSVVIDLLKMMMSPPFLTGLLITAVNGVIFTFLFNFAAPAAFPYFTPVSFLEGIAIVMIFNIIFSRLTPPPVQEKKVDDIALLQALLASRPRSSGPGASAGGPASNDSPGRAASGPQRPMSAAPGR